MTSRRRSSKRPKCSPGVGLDSLVTLDFDELPQPHVEEVRCAEEDFMAGPVKHAGGLDKKEERLKSSASKRHWRSAPAMSPLEKFYNLYIAPYDTRDLGKGKKRDKRKTSKDNTISSVESLSPDPCTAEAAPLLQEIEDNANNEKDARANPEMPHSSGRCWFLERNLENTGQAGNWELKSWRNPETVKKEKDGDPMRDDADEPLKNSVAEMEAPPDGSVPLQVRSTDKDSPLNIEVNPERIKIRDGQEKMAFNKRHTQVIILGEFDSYGFAEDTLGTPTTDKKSAHGSKDASSEGKRASMNIRGEHVYINIGGENTQIKTYKDYGTINVIGRNSKKSSGKSDKKTNAKKSPGTSDEEVRECQAEVSDDQELSQPGERFEFGKDDVSDKVASFNSQREPSIIPLDTAERDQEDARDKLDVYTEEGLVNNVLETMNTAHVYWTFSEQKSLDLTELQSDNDYVQATFSEIHGLREDSAAGSELGARESGNKVDLERTDQLDQCLLGSIKALGSVIICCDEQLGGKETGCPEAVSLVYGASEVPADPSNTTFGYDVIENMDAVDEAGLVDVYKLRRDMTSKGHQLKKSMTKFREKTDKVARLQRYLEQLRLETDEMKRLLAGVDKQNEALRCEAAEMRCTVTAICDHSVATIGKDTEARRLEPACYRRYVNIRTPADAASALTAVRNRIKALGDLEVLIYRKQLVLHHVLPSLTQEKPPPPKRVNRPAHKSSKTKKADQTSTMAASGGNIVIEVISPVVEITTPSWSEDVSHTDSPMSISIPFSGSNDGTGSTHLAPDTEV